MGLLKIIENDGAVFKKIGDIHGGEFKGPCPWCGGSDRFTIYENYKGGRYICRKCEKHGDALQYLQDKKGLSYYKACLELNITPVFESEDDYKEKSKNNQIAAWEPKQLSDPPEIWSDKAAGIAFTAFKYLLSPQGKPYRDYLNSRGIINESIKKNRLGWNNQEIFFSRETWGMDPELNLQTGKAKNIWIPAGLVIPYFENEKCIRLRIRQENPVDKNRYVVVSGSKTSFMFFKSYNKSNPVMLLESELDGILINQIAGDIINPVAIGSSSARSDIYATNLLKKTSGLCSLDYDEAGIKETAFWEKNFGFIKWPSLRGKDPSEDLKQGINLRTWVLSGVSVLPKREIVQKTMAQEEIKPVLNNTQTTKSDEIQKPEKTKPERKYTNKCMHGLSCNNFSWIENQELNFNKPTCLIKNEGVFFIKTCPLGKWKKVTKNAVSVVVINPISRRAA